MSHVFHVPHHHQLQTVQLLNVAVTSSNVWTAAEEIPSHIPPLTLVMFARYYSHEYWSAMVLPAAQAAHHFVPSATPLSHCSKIYQRCKLFVARMYYFLEIMNHDL
jgi:hypothetical protein